VGRQSALCVVLAGGQAVVQAADEAVEDRWVQVGSGG